MAKGKKIKLQKRSTPLTRTREGLSLPEGAGNSGYIGFQNAQDLKEKYFVRTFAYVRSFCSPIYVYLYFVQSYCRRNYFGSAMDLCTLRYFIDPFYCAYSHVANISRYQTMS